MTEPRHDKAWRIRQLLDLLAGRGEVSVAEGAEALGVSPATVRRDFTTLATQQLAVRTHGGIVAGSVSYDLPVRYRAAERSRSVERIAVAAAATAAAGEVVGFNGGTTATRTARALAARTDLAPGGAGSSLTVVTNALNIAAEMVLRPHIRTVSVGGVARPQSYEVVGPLAEQLLAEVWLDRLFLGLDGLCPTYGASCSEQSEARVNALMVSHAATVTVVTTSPKLGRRTFARICDVGAIDALITDTDADRDLVAALRDRGVAVDLV